MNPVSNTAYLTCGARAEDADKDKPVCDDRYARRLLGKDGKAVYLQFKGETESTASIVVRHRMIDDLLRERLAGNPDTVVILLGAGFDSRAFRLKGGRWFEIDEAPVIERKNAVLPAGDCGNPLRRVAIDFAQEALVDKLPRLSTSNPVIVVMEGIFFYLDDTQRNATLAALHEVYPRHSLICDLNTRSFMERYGKSLTRRIEALGATLPVLSENPAAHFLAAGYSAEAHYSIVEKTVAFSGKWYAALLAWFLPRIVREGLALHVFRLVPKASAAQSSQ